MRRPTLVSNSIPVSSLLGVVVPVLLSASASGQKHGLFTFEEGGGDSLGQSVALSPVTNFNELYPDVIVGAPLDGLQGQQSGCVRVYGAEDGIERFVRHGQLGDQYGAAVAVGDDWNVDGTLDLVVGAPQGAGPCPNAGYVEILSGVDGSTLVTLSGTEACSLFGTSVAVVEDIDGDGFSEVIVGAPEHGVGGAVFVVSPFAPTAPISGLVSPVAGSRLGAAVASYADYNGDAKPDVIAGAPFASFNGALSGSAFLLSGVDASVLRTWHGQQAREYLGSSVATADVNGDGLAEVLLGSPQGAPGTGIATGPGLVRIISGADGHAPVTTLIGEATGDFFGAAVSTAGDADGDGDEEVVVGSPGAANGGKVAVWNVGPDTEGLEVFAEQPGGVVGAAVTGGLDVNRDGVSDIAVGEPAAGVARVLSTQPLTFHADLHKISTVAGGVTKMSIDAGPDYGFLAYYVLGSATGTVPGTFLVNMHVPLNWGPYFCELFVYPNTGPFDNSLGSLSADGKATMTLTVGAGALGPQYIGLHMVHTFVVFNPSDFVAPLKFVGKQLTPLTIIP